MQWSPIRSKISCPPPATSHQASQRMMRDAYSAARSKNDIAKKINMPLAELEARWNPNESYNIRKHLFTMDQAGKVYPAFVATADMYRRVIDAYALWYRIPQQAMKDFWMDFVDALLLCHEFEEKAPDNFKAWAYGRLCRYVLAERQQIRSSAEPYDPVTNFRI